MPPRRRATFTPDEHRADDNVSNHKDAHVKVSLDRGKRGSATKVKDNNTPETGGDDAQEQVDAEHLAVGRRQASRRGGSNALPPGQSTPVLPIQVPTSLLKAAERSSNIKRRLDSLPTQVHGTQMATRPELKQDQALNLRSSTRTRRAVCYNEQSPGSHPSSKKPPTASKPKANAAAKRNASAALPPSGAAKRVKEDPTSTIEETLAVSLAATSHVKRGRARNQELKSSQSRVDDQSAAVLNTDKHLLLQEAFALAPATSQVKRGRTRGQELKTLPSHIFEDSAAVKSADKILFLQTPRRMSSKPHRVQSAETATATNQERVSNTPQNHWRKQSSRKVSSSTLQEKVMVHGLDLSMASTMNANVNFNHTSQKSRRTQISKKVTNSPQKQDLVGESMGLKSMSVASSMNSKLNSGDSAQNQRKKLISKKATSIPKEQVMADESTGLESLSTAVVEGLAQNLPTSEVVDMKSVLGQELMDGLKSQNAAKENTGNSRQMSTAAQKTEVALSACNAEPKEVCVSAPSKAQTGRKTVTRKRTLPSEHVDEARSGKVSEVPLVQVAWNAEIGNGHDLALNCNFVEKGGAQESTNAGRNPQCQTQQKGRKTVTRKRTSPGTRGDETDENATVLEMPLVQLAGKNPLCQTQQKGRKTVTRKRTLPGTRGDETENATVLEIPLVQLENGEGWSTDTKLEEICGTCKSTNGDTLRVETQEKEKKTASRKRTLQGATVNKEQKMGMTLVQGSSNVQISNVHDSAAMDGKAQTRGRSTAKRIFSGRTQQAKKLKTSESGYALPLSPEPSIQKLVEVAEAAENHEPIKVIQDVDPQDWSAMDITNLGSKVDGLSEKKRKEEGKRKRAMKFDALPVGFGLGISCWSPSPPKCQELELIEVNNPSEVRDSVIDIQAPLMYTLGEAEKQPCLQEVAMLEDTIITVSSIKDMNTQPVNLYTVPTSVIEIERSSFSEIDAKRVSGSGLQCSPDKDKGANPQGKGKVKRQVSGKAKKTPASLVSSPQAALKSDSDIMLVEETSEPGIDGLISKTQQSSRRGAATRGQRTTRSTKQ